MDTDCKSLNALEWLELYHQTHSKNMAAIFETKHNRCAVLCDRARQVIERLPVNIKQPMPWFSYGNDYDTKLTLYWKAVGWPDNEYAFLMRIEKDVFFIGEKAFSYDDVETELVNRLIDHFKKLGVEIADNESL